MNFLTIFIYYFFVFFLSMIRNILHGSHCPTK
jgi:hypothetical protein